MSYYQDGIELPTEANKVVKLNIDEKEALILIKERINFMANFTKDGLSFYEINAIDDCMEKIKRYISFLRERAEITKGECIWKI